MLDKKGTEVWFLGTNEKCDKCFSIIKHAETYYITVGRSALCLQNHEILEDV